MKRWVIFILTMFLMGALIACAQETTATTPILPTTENTITTTTTTTSIIDTTRTDPLTYSLEQLQSDYDEFLSALERNPKIFADENELTEVLAAQRESLRSGMTALEFYRVLSVASAAVRCGHTGVQPPDSAVEGIFDNPLTFPLRVRLFGGHLMVISDSGNTVTATGDEIIAVNGTLIPDLIEDLMKFLGADGQGTSLKTIVLQDNFFEYYLLFLGDSDVLTITSLQAGTGESHVETLERSVPNTVVWTPQPAVESAFFDGYAVLTVNSFYPEEPESIQSIYADFAAFFDRVDLEETPAVILDLRGNSGGDPRLGSRLFSYLAAYPQPYFAASSPSYYTGLKSEVPLSEPHFDGELVTLIDGFCFSTCGHFAALLRYQGIGTFIGSETGGSYICSDSSRTTVLSETGLYFVTSTAAWEVAVDGLTFGRGIMPDIFLEATFEDVISGKDTVMEAAISYISGQTVIPAE